MHVAVAIIVVFLLFVAGLVVHHQVWQRYFPCQSYGLVSHQPVFRGHTAMCERCNATWTSAFCPSVAGGDPMMGWKREDQCVAHR